VTSGMKRAVKTSAEPQLMLQQYLPYRLAVVARAISNELAQRYSDDCGISTPEWRVIAHLAAVPACSSGELCERTAMDKATVNRAVSRLVAAGHVLADVAKRDRRLNVLTLSARGKAIHKVVVPLALDVEAKLLDALSAGEQSVLFRSIEKLSRRIEDIRQSRETKAVGVRALPKRS
jgi:DNA-binding MarR family transcriptional regulator